MTKEPLALVRNMSAPPRTTLSFSPLKAASRGSRNSFAGGTSLAFVCRLQTAEFTPKRYVGRRRRDGNWEPFGQEDRIRIAYPFAHAEAEGRRRPTPEARHHAAHAPVETLADELCRFAASVAISGAALPPVGIFLPPHDTVRAIEGSLCRTIAILSRRRGTVFLRDADSIVWQAMDGETLDLWAPAVAKGART